MHWIVHTSEGDINLTSADLVMQLTERGMKDTRPPHEELVKTLIDYLESKNLLSKCTPYQIALMSMDLGYFYKVFLTQNKVTINAIQSSESNGTGSKVSSNS